MTFYDYDQLEWGSSKNNSPYYYDDDPSRVPLYLVIHYGGGTNDIIGVDNEMYRLRAWQNYHINSRGMRDIAYCYAVGDSGTIYRMRGNNDNGGNKSSDRTPEGDPYNEVSISVVWIGGVGAGEPTPAAYASMAKVIEHHPGLVVKTHNLTKVENGSGTGCPGDYWKQWVYREGWNDYKQGEVELGMPYEQFKRWITALFEGRPDVFIGDPWYFYLTMAEGGIYDDPTNEDWDNFWRVYTSLVFRTN